MFIFALHKFSNRKLVRDMGGLEIATSTVVLVDRDMQETSDASF